MPFSLRRRFGGPASLSSLGPLELQLLETVWSLSGDPESPAREIPAREIKDAVQQPLAYTTVTTTLDRLCKKGLLDRVKHDRAFVYRARYSSRALREFEAREAIRNLASNGGGLISCLVDAVTQHDAALLDELEASIRRRRAELKRDAESGGAAQ